MDELKRSERNHILWRLISIFDPRRYKIDIGTRSHNQCCRGKAISITYYECVSVALGIRQGTSMACPALKYISTLSHKRHDFQKEKVTEHKACLLSFSKNLSPHSKKNSAR